ncbi:fibronectin type III domain-containing protein [Isosphaeraceae bacterium EP7]
MNKKRTLISIFFMIAANQIVLAQDRPDPPTGLRGMVVGESDLVRLTWDAPSDGKGLNYEIWRTPSGKNDWVMVARTTVKPPTLVYVDRTNVKSEAKFTYKIRTIAESTYSVFGDRQYSATIPKPKSTIYRIDDFDDGRLKGPWTSIPKPSDPNDSDPKWFLEDGKMIWRKGAQDPAISSRLLLGSSRIVPTAPSAMQITARIAVAPDSKLVPATPLGIGLSTDESGRGYNLVLRTEETSNVFRLTSEKGSQTSHSDLEPNEGLDKNVSWVASTKDSVIWYWVQLRVDQNSIRAKYWPDADTKNVGSQLVNLTDATATGSPLLPVLIGSGANASAIFGEVYIEDFTNITVADEPIQFDENNLETPRSIASSDGKFDEKELARLRVPADSIRGLPDDAFDATPTVIRLVTRGDIPPENDTELTSQGGRTFLENAREDTSPFDFAAPAHFPLPKFGDCPEEIEAEGLVIHEGMRFVAAPNGLYEVRFVASAPAMPVTVRLQLRLDYGLKFDQTLTIPPIVILPHVDALGESKAATWKVRHLGYSSSLVRHDLAQRDPRTAEGVFQPAEPSSSSQLLCLKSVRRRGVARFGSYPSSQSSPRY